MSSLRDQQAPERSTPRLGNGSVPLRVADMEPAVDQQNQPVASAARTILSRHRRSLTLSTLAGGAIGAALWLATPVQYTAHAALLLDAPQMRRVDGSAAPAFSMGADAMAVIEGQMRTLRSDAVLDPVIEDLALIDDPEFNGSAPKPLTLLRELLSGGSASGSNVLARTRNVLRASVQTAQTDNSHVVRVSVTSTSAPKSARLANAIAQNFIDTHGQQSVNTAQDNAKAALSAVLQDTEKRLSTFRAEIGLTAGSDGSESVPLTGLGAAEIARVQARQAVEAARASIQIASVPASVDAVTTASVPDSVQSIQKMAGRQGALRDAVSAEQSASQEIARITAALSLGAPDADKLAQLERQVVAARNALAAATANASPSDDPSATDQGATIFAQAVAPRQPSQHIGPMALFAGLFAGFAMSSGAAALGGRRQRQDADDFTSTRSETADPSRPVMADHAPSSSRHDEHQLTFKPRAKRGKKGKNMYPPYTPYPHQQTASPDPAPRMYGQAQVPQAHVPHPHGGYYPMVEPMPAPMPHSFPVPMTTQPWGHAPQPMPMPMHSVPMQTMPPQPVAPMHPAQQGAYYGQMPMAAMPPMQQQHSMPPVQFYPQPVYVPVYQPLPATGPQQYQPAEPAVAGQHQRPRRAEVIDHPPQARHRIDRQDQGEHGSQPAVDPSPDEREMDEMRQSVRDIRAVIDALAARRYG